MPPEPERVRTGVARRRRGDHGGRGARGAADRGARGRLRDRARPAAARAGPPGRRRLTVPPRRLRLDAELVRRGLARSREHASELIEHGRVKVSGAVATKPATGVTTDVAIVVADDPDRPDYVSRGGHKLAGALAAFEPGGFVVVRSALPGRGRVHGRVHRRAAPARRGPGGGSRRRATASWRGSCSPTTGCVVRDRVNVRELTTEITDGPVDVVVGDLSFISLELVLDALLGVTAPDGDLALMVKPQFEVGKDRVGKGGVVRDPALRAEAVGERRRGGRAAGLGRAHGRDQPAARPVRQRGVLPLAAPGAGDPRRGGHPQCGARRRPTGGGG